MKFFNNLFKKESKITVASGSKRVRISNSFLMFSNLYEAKKPLKYALVYLLSIINAFLLLIFIQKTGLYSFGISSLTQGFARLVFVLLKSFDETQRLLIFNILYWLLYVFINIPLIIFSYKKIGKNFTILSTHFVVASNVFGFLISIIPGSDNLSPMLASITDTNFWKAAKDLNQSAGFVPFLWSDTSQGNVIISTFIYAAIYGFYNGISVSLLYILGGSAGGADFLTQYYARKKNRSVGSILFYVNSFILIIAILIGSFVAGSLLLQDVNNYRDSAWEVSLFFSPNLIATFFSILLTGTVVSYLFPRYNFAEIKVFTDKLEEVRKALLSDNANHSLSIQETLGGYSLLKKKMIISVSMYVEIPHLIKIIRQIDKDCLVSITRIRGIDGHIYLRQN
ncbi:YitT family protein [Mycoplasmoides genitalium]